MYTCKVYFNLNHFIFLGGKLSIKTLEMLTDGEWLIRVILFEGSGPPGCVGVDGGEPVLLKILLEVASCDSVSGLQDVYGDLWAFTSWMESIRLLP